MERVLLGVSVWIQMASWWVGNLLLWALSGLLCGIVWKDITVAFEGKSCYKAKALGSRSPQI